MKVYLRPAGSPGEPGAHEVLCPGGPLIGVVAQVRRAGSGSEPLWGRRPAGSRLLTGAYASKEGAAVALVRDAGPGRSART